MFAERHGKIAHGAITQKGCAATGEERLRGNIVDRRSLVLPAFVGRREDPRPGEFLSDYWAVSEAGDWERDVEIGNAHGRDAIRFIREERAPHILNWIASEMVYKRHFGPVEIGFFHEIGALVVRTRR